MAEQDFKKPEWQAAWSGYVSANGTERVSADLALLFDVLDDYPKPEIVSRYCKGQRDWATALAGQRSVSRFIENVESLRKTIERFPSSERVGR